MRGAHPATMITKAIKTINPPPEFQKIIQDKTCNFSGRKHIFNQIKTFLNKYPRGYLTLVSFPGSGKSAILAQYYLDNPNVIYYNCQLPGKNNAPQFLLNICTQLIENYPTTYSGFTRQCRRRWLAIRTITPAG